MKFLRKLINFLRATPHIDPTPSIIPEPENTHEKEYAVLEAQWSDTFQESLRDFQVKFTEEETARSAGERTRRDEFDRTMSNFLDTFLKNDRRRRELYKETEALEKERSYRAHVARHAIFVQGRQDRARACESDQEMRAKRAEWYSGVRKELLKDGRQRLTEKYDALNAALVDQFDRLMKRQKRMMEVAEEQSSLQDTLIPLPLDGGMGPVDSQSITSLPPSPKSPSSPSSPFTEYFCSPLQPTSTESNDQKVTWISQSPSQSMRSLFQSPSSPNLEGVNPLIQQTSTESNNQHKQSSYLVEQDDFEGSTQSDGVKAHTSFMRSQEQRQERFLQDESERDHRFHASEDARDTGELQRSTIFDQHMEQWTRKSQACHYHRRRSFHHRSYSQCIERQYWTVFYMSMSHIEKQAKAEMDSEEICFQRQKDMILDLYKSQTIQLDQHITEDQIVWFEFMRGRYCRKPRKPLSSLVTFGEAIQLTSPQYKYKYRNEISPRLCEEQPKDSDPGLAPPAMFRGPLIQKALPIPKVSNGQEPILVSRMQKMFEQSQELRAEAFQKGAKKRKYTFTINEAQREAQFVKCQQERKKIFDQAEELRESKFEEAQQQRESEFQAHEQKLEDDFHKMEMEMDRQARKAREDGEQEFQSTMSALQKKCIDDEKQRLEELERLGEELLMRREPGLESLNID